MAKLSEIRFAIDDAVGDQTELAIVREFAAVVGRLLSLAALRMTGKISPQNLRFQGARVVLMRRDDFKQRGEFDLRGRILTPEREVTALHDLRAKELASGEEVGAAHYGSD